MNKKQAIKKFKEFHEKEAKKIKPINIPLNEGDHIVQLGKCLELAYSSKKWGTKINNYIHKFDSKPNLYANTKGNMLIIMGNFKIKNAGITG